MVSKDCLINYMSIAFFAKTNNIAFARNVASTFIYHLNPTIGYLNEIKTIVSEAVTNAIIHGYLENEKEEVVMNLCYDDENIYIEVIDSGIGINDISLARTPMYTDNANSERCGLGFTIMEVFSDRFEVESHVNEGTKISIIKRIKEHE